MPPPGTRPPKTSSRIRADPPPLRQHQRFNEFERNCNIARDLAAAATQPANAPSAAPAASELPPLPGRWETSKITDPSTLNNITHVTLLFHPDHTLEGRSDFNDNTHISGKGTWSLQNDTIQITIDDDESQKLVAQNDTLLLTIKNDKGETLFIFKKTSPDPTFPPAPESPNAPNQ